MPALEDTIVHEWKIIWYITIIATSIAIYPM
jgi:hypothetical protein